MALDRRREWNASPPLDMNGRAHDLEKLLPIFRDGRWDTCQDIAERNLGANRYVQDDFCVLFSNGACHAVNIDPGYESMAGRLDWHAGDSLIARQTPSLAD